MGSSFMPQSIAGFTEYIKNAYEKVIKKQADYKIDAEKLILLTEYYHNFITAEEIASNPDTATTGNRRVRDAARKKLTALWRKFLNEHVRYNSAVNQSDLAVFGIKPPKEHYTTAVAPTTFPVLEIDFSKHQKHTIRFLDSESSGKKKPQGVHACQFWYKLGNEVPTKDEDFVFLEDCTRTPLTVDFDLHHQGKRSYYRARWVNTRGEVGPWGMTESAIIA